MSDGGSESETAGEGTRKAKGRGATEAEKAAESATEAEKGRRSSRRAQGQNDRCRPKRWIHR
jgi:hypothetical protein